MRFCFVGRRHANDRQSLCCPSCPPCSPWPPCPFHGPSALWISNKLRVRGRSWRIFHEWTVTSVAVVELLLLLGFLRFWPIFERSRFSKLRPAAFLFFIYLFKLIMFVILALSFFYSIFASFYLVFSFLVFKFFWGGYESSWTQILTRN